MEARTVYSDSAAAVAVIVMTLHSGGTSSGADGASSSTVADGQAAGSIPAAEVAVSPLGSGQSGMPASFVGRWAGTLTDNTGVEGPQAAQLTLAGGEVNTLAGTVSYPNVGCGYSLRLISAAANQVQLFEEIQSGPCISEYVTLTRSDIGITESVYASQPSGQQPDFYGTLTKGTAG